MKAVVFGGTGATGRQLVQQLCASEKWTKITTIGRREVPVDEFPDDCKSKLVQLTASFEALDPVKSSMVEHDVCFHCLGTTRALAGGADTFVKIERDFTAAAAAAAYEAGIPHFSVVSAQGANPNARAVEWLHPTLYVKTLGEKEEACKKQPFRLVSVFRPGMLDRLLPKGDPGYRWHENLAKKVLSALPVSDLARMMIADAEKQASAIAAGAAEGAAAKGSDSGCVGGANTKVYEDKMIKQLVASL